MSNIIVSTDPKINGGINKINRLIQKNFKITKYIIISNDKPDKNIKFDNWIKCYGYKPIIIFNIFKFFDLISKNKNKNKNIILSDPQFSLISYFLIFINFFFKKKIFFLSHGFFFHNNSFNIIKKIYFKFIKYFFLNYFKIISISPNDSNILKKNKFFNYIEIFNGVEKIKSSKKKKYFFCLIARNVKSKNIKNYINFLYFLKKNNIKYNNLKSVLISDNINDLYISELKNLHVYSKLNDYRYKNILSRSKYIMSFSDYEGFGLSIIEGVGAGLIPICKQNSSFEIIFKDCKYLLFKKYNSKMLLKILIKIENMKKKDLKELFKKLNKIYLKFSINNMIKKYKLILN